jgi:hypothetical protein
MVSAEPARPLALSRLVKMDRYDIINELRLTLTVNDQSPVAPGVAPEIFPQAPAGRPRSQGSP